MNQNEMREQIFQKKMFKILNNPFFLLIVLLGQKNRHKDTFES